MTTTPTTIAASAAALGGALVAGALVQGDVALAWGLAVSAAVMLLNFGLWVLAVQRLFDEVLSGGSGNGATFLIATKMVGIGFSTWGLVVLFPALAVLLGGSVVVFSIFLHAAVLGAAELTAPREA